MTLRREPATVEQLTGALEALGLYLGSGAAAEHEAEAARFGGPGPYRMQLANALLGAAQTEALLCEPLAATVEQTVAAHRQQLRTAGMMTADSPVPDRSRLVHFLRWQTLRVAGPLLETAETPDAGPLPLAAAATANGLQQLLGVLGTASDSEVLALGDDLRATRDCLQDAIANIDTVTSMLDSLSTVLRPNS